MTNKLMRSASAKSIHGSSVPERRRHPRRSRDRRQFALAELARWFLDSRHQPHFVVNDRMKLLVMNAAAKRFLDDSKVISVSTAGLAFASARHRAELDRVLSGATEQVSLTARSAQSPAAISIRRLPLSDDRYGYLLITAHPTSGIDNGVLRKELGLTNAETEIALAIFKGMTLVEIAKQRQASINTVKTQVRYIFQKCRVHSQVGLTRRIGEIVQAQ